jgi:hypothetical protein
MSNFHEIVTYSWPKTNNVVYVYLTSGINFEVYISNISEIVTYHWPKRNNVVDDQ